MNKKEKNLLLMILVSAFLLLLVLYSPIGSPDNYVQNYYTLENQGVNFSGSIQNAPKNANSGFSNSQNAFSSQINLKVDNSFASNANLSPKSSSIDVTPTDYNTASRNTPKYSVSSPSEASSTSPSSNASYSVQSRTSVFSNQNNSGGSMSGGMIGGGSAIIGKSTSDNNTNPQLNGFIALNSSIDLSVFNDLTTKQGDGYTPGSGATDPGEDPTEEPIPVPDGFWILLSMVIAYTATKYFKKRPQTV